MSIMQPPESKVLYCLVSCRSGKILSQPSKQQSEVSDFIAKAPSGQYTLGTLYLVKSPKGWQLREKSPANLKLVRQFLPANLLHLAEE